MPFRPEHSLLRVEVPALHHIDTTSVENLFGMWSLFAKASDAMEDGKRLENLSWRLWNRETFCCAPQSLPSRHAPARPRSNQARSKTAATTRDPAMPALSTSLDSIPSDDEECEPTSLSVPTIPQARPELRRDDSTMSIKSAKHITPLDLEKMVVSIKESKLEPIDYPMSTPSSRANDPPTTNASSGVPKLDLTLSQSPPCSQETVGPHHTDTDSQSTLLESSASTVATNDGSEGSITSQIVSSQDSSSTEMSSHSVVRGFVPGGAPSSYRSQTNLAAKPTTILKTSPSYRQMPPPKKKGAMFLVGSSSGEDESSFESSMHRSALSESIKHPESFQSDGSKKKTSFKEEVAVARAPARHSPVFESDDEDDDVSESAIEDDDDSSDWEDSDDASRPSSVNETGLFQRVDSRPNLTSQRSLLTTLMHEPDRAKALASAASRSTPAIRRSRASTPNGPSVATTPDNGSQLFQAQQIPEMPRSKPIIMTTSNTHQSLAQSPRSTRRNMLSSELTESLRKNLLWERQHKSTGNLAALKRRHTSHDVKNLRQHPEPGPVLQQQNGTKTFTNEYFHAGLGEYHAKGW